MAQRDQKLNQSQASNELVADKKGDSLQVAADMLINFAMNSTEPPTIRFEIAKAAILKFIPNIKEEQPEEGKTPQWERNKQLPPNLLKFINYLNPKIEAMSKDGAPDQQMVAQALLNFLIFSLEIKIRKNLNNDYENDAPVDPFSLHAITDRGIILDNKAYELFELLLYAGTATEHEYKDILNNPFSETAITTIKAAEARINADPTLKKEFEKLKEVGELTKVAEDVTRMDELDQKDAAEVARFAAMEAGLTGEDLEQALRLAQQRDETRKIAEVTGVSEGVSGGSSGWSLLRTGVAYLGGYGLVGTVVGCVAVGIAIAAGAAHAMSLQALWSLVSIPGGVGVLAGGRRLHKDGFFEQVRAWRSGAANIAASDFPANLSIELTERQETKSELTQFDSTTLQSIQETSSKLFANMLAAYNQTPDNTPSHSVSKIATKLGLSLDSEQQLSLDSEVGAENQSSSETPLLQGSQSQDQKDLNQSKNKVKK